MSTNKVSGRLASTTQLSNKDINLDSRRRGNDDNVVYLCQRTKFSARQLYAHLCLSSQSEEPAPRSVLGTRRLASTTQLSNKDINLDSRRRGNDDEN